MSKSFVAGFVCVVLSMLTTGCTMPDYIKTVDTNPICWDYPVSIIYDNSDTLSLVNLSVVVRYNDDFKDDKIDVTMHLSTPDVYQCREQISLSLMRPYFGTAVQSSESLFYRENCCLNSRGNYIFTIIPSRSMRGIEAVGIEIDRDGKR